MHAWDRFTPIDETLAAADDLVRSGKVRYLGVSDTPAWKVAEAQTIARFRGSAPFIALQIEYSLLERTVEGELVPMALEMGLGVTPWSPLKSGALTGKYKREDIGKHKPDRAGFLSGALANPKTYDITEELGRVAGELGTTAARVALAWVQGRPGVASTIIGARTLAQLDDNIEAIDVALSPDQRQRLDALSEPTLGFPAPFLKMATMFTHAGATVNGVPSMVWPAIPKNDSERY
jgi:aryl-alcohol dehydrogenase-like predicted oxidoreductase